MVPQELPVITPHTMNRLKAAGLCAIHEEKRLSTDRVMEGYPDIWRTIQFHGFERFTQAHISYVPTCVQEFYEAYAYLITKNKKGVTPGLISLVDVHEMKTMCSALDINEAICCDYTTRDSFQDKLPQSLESLKTGLAPLLM